MKCFTRLVKTTISHLDLLIIMYFIDHSGSTYWHKKDSEKVKILSQNRTLSDILNVHQLEIQGADIQPR